MNLDGRPYGSGRKCNKLSIAEAAYIAGIIDGEGTIGTTSRNPTVKRDRARLTLRVAVSMTTPRIAEWLIEVTGLGFRERQGYTRKGNQCPTFIWSAAAAGAASLLEQVLPYLLLKQANAVALLRIHGEMLRDRSLIKSETWRNEVKAHFHNLNAKGLAGRERKASAQLKELPVPVPLDCFLPSSAAEVKIDVCTFRVSMS